MKHIGLIGLAGSGKDTAAKALYSLGYMRYAFADRVKNLAWRFGWDGNKDERGRALLQNIGMAGRQYDPATWIKYVELMIEHETDLGLIVFTDVRFQNEADYVRGKGGIIIRIVRPGQSAENHESELNQSAVAADIEIVNDGSIEDLHNKIKQLI
jgi:dephospho-CoA kinase